MKTTLGMHFILRNRSGVIARSGLCDEAIPYCGLEIASPLRGSQ
jgi:hypothetical protein